MGYKKQNWVPYDDNKPEEENVKAGAVVTAERMNYMESGIKDIGNQIDTHEGNKLNPHQVTKEQIDLGNVKNIEQASKTEFESHELDIENPHKVTKKQLDLENVDNFKTAKREEAEAGTAVNLLMTPKGVKQHIDSRMGTQEEVDTGEAKDKIISPKTLADLLSKKMPLKMYWGPGSTTKESPLNSRLPFGNLIGIDPFHKSTDVPFTINSGKYEATMTRDADLFFDINLRLQGGGASTVYSDYYYIQIEYGSQTGGSGENKRDFAMIGANSGQRLNLSNTLTGKAIVSLKKGQKFALTATGLRDGQKIFSWQFLSGTIEEYILA